MASEVFESTKVKDDELRVEVAKARERAGANPDDHDAQTALVNVCEEGRKLWESCEIELSRLDRATTDGDEHAMLVQEITMARNIAKGYGIEAERASNAAEDASKPPSPFNAKKQKNSSNNMPLWARIAIAAVLLIAFIAIIGVIKGTPSHSDEPSTEQTAEDAQEPATETEQAPTPEPAPESVPEPTAQIFDTDFGTLEYRGIQDAVGNAVVSFMLTNKSGVTVSGVPENLVVNGQFNVQSLGGVSSLSGINAGNSGAVAFTFGVPTQTTLESVTEITSISGDLRVFPCDHIMDTIGYIHFDVVV